MTLQDELEPKLAQIRPLAKNMFAGYLKGRGLAFGEGEAIVVDEGPDEYQSVPPDVDPEQEQAKWNTLSSSIDDVVNRFRGFYVLDIPELSEMSDRLGGKSKLPLDEGRGTDPHGGLFGGRDAFNRLHSANADWMQHVDDLLDKEDWSGPAARTFYEQMLSPFLDTVERQKFYVRELAMVVDWYDTSVQQAKESVKWIAGSCITAFREVSGPPADNETVGKVLSVASTAMGVLALYPPLSVPAGGLGVVFGVLSLAAGENDKGEDNELRVYGVNAPRIIDRCWDALGALEARIADVDWRIGYALDLGVRGNGQEKGPFAAGPDLEIPEPDLAAGTGDFGQLKGLTKDGVVGALVDIYKAGYVSIPGAANEYHQALVRVDSCELPTALKRYFWRSLPKFNGVRDHLSGVLRRTRDNLTESGDALVDTAKDYQLNDEQNADLMRRIGKIDPPPEDYTSPLGSGGG